MTLSAIRRVRVRWGIAVSIALVAGVLGACSGSSSHARSPVSATLLSSPAPPVTSTATPGPSKTPTPTKPKTTPKPKPKTTPVHHAPTPASHPAPKPTPTKVAGPPPSGGVTAVGDSVLVDATPSLQATIPGINIDAAVSRQVDEGLSLLQSMRSSGRLGGSVVFALGTNGTFSSDAFSQLVQLTSGRHLVVVTAHCGHCSWVIPDNSMIHSRCNSSTHCTIADWYSLAEAHPSWFADAPDGVHMPQGGAGAQAYARMVAQAL